jgi:hypothetical protein
MGEGRSEVRPGGGNQSACGRGGNQAAATKRSDRAKRKDSPYRSGRSPDWLKMKNPACEAVKREAEEDWGK